MASGANMVELKTQEIVFLGNMFVHTSEMVQYAQVVEDNGLISTEPAKSIWKKMITYFQKYDCLPPEDLFEGIFTEKELENLNLGIAIAGSEVEHAMFILDCFADTAKTILYKQSMARLEKLFDDGKADLEHANESIKILTDALLAVERVASGQADNIASTLKEWRAGRLRVQSGFMPIPIPGLEFVRGTPAGSVNVIVGGYGAGKSSSLCTMASELVKTQNVLYVTLEMPAEVISFRIMSCQSAGKISSDLVFLDPRTFTDNERKRINELTDQVQGKYSVHLLDLPAGSATSNQLELYLTNLITRYKLQVGTVIVDYAALMKTNTGAGKEDIGWGYTGVILKELAAVAKKLGITIWTAAQAGGGAAHTITDATGFKPLRGNDLYGSKEVLQDASYVLGLSLMRSREFPRLATGILSTIKNRYGGEFHDYVCTVDYATSTLKSDGIVPHASDGDLITLVDRHLKDLENNHRITNALAGKQESKENSKYYFKGLTNSVPAAGALIKPKAPKTPQPSFLKKPKKTTEQQDSREESY